MRKIGTARDFLPSYLSAIFTTTWLPSASVANRLLQVEDSCALEMRRVCSFYKYGRGNT